MLSFFALHLIAASSDCAFETAFEKGQQDVEVGSFGANVDRFCQFATDDERTLFPKAYDLGRQYGPTLKKAGIKLLPKDKSELDGLLRDANSALSTKELIDKISKSQKSEPLESNDKIQDLTKRLDALEAENKRLTEKLADKPLPDNSGR